MCIAKVNQTFVLVECWLEMVITIVTIDRANCGNKHDIELAA